MAHPLVRWRLRRLFQENRAACVRIGEDHLDLAGALCNLERIRHVHRARDARHVAAHLRIAIDPVLRVVTLHRRRLGRVGNLVAVDDPGTCRDETDGPQRKNRRGEDRTVCVDAGLRDRRPDRVRQQIPVRSVRDLPDAVQVRPAIDPRRTRGLPGRAARGQREHSQDDNTCGGNGRAGESSAHGPFLHSSSVGDCRRLRRDDNAGTPRTRPFRYSDHMMG